MEWLNTIIQGILLGGLYAMFAAGLSLIFGVMRLVNIAHGDLIVLAAYVALVVTEALGVNPLLSILAVAPLMAAIGYALQRDVANVVTKNDGKVLGEVRHPINTNDFSSFLLQAQASKAQVIGLANAGGDTINSIKQASEFGIVKGGQKLAGLLVFVSDVHSLGLERAQGLNLTEAFYWDLNDKTRAFSKRFGARNNGKMPTSIQAGFYSAALQYLNAVKAANTDNSDQVMAKLKEIKWDDPIFGLSYIRQDGRKMHNMYLFEVKKPSESKGPYDYYKLITTMSAEEAFRPLDQGECPLVKKN